MKQSPLTLIVLTRNEELNLGPCLESAAGWTKEMFVVDSGSTDRTLEIAQKYGATVLSHPFETHARQWKWALQNLPISTEWVLALDADQRVTPKLRDEITSVLNEDAGTEINGYYVKRKQIFRGRWIKHGGYYPKYLLKLFRRGAAWSDERDRVDHHFRVRGRARKLQHDIIEDNRNEADISIWIEKHNRYASLQAQEDYERSRECGNQSVKPSWTGSPDQRILRLKQIWSRLPLYIRPLVYFLYRYFFRLGFLDGKEGFIFHFLQAYWYRLLIDIKLDELRHQTQEEQKERLLTETASANKSLPETASKSVREGDLTERPVFPSRAL